MTFRDPSNTNYAFDSRPLIAAAKKYNEVLKMNTIDKIIKQLNENMTQISQITSDLAKIRENGEFMKKEPGKLAKQFASAIGAGWPTHKNVTFHQHLCEQTQELINRLTAPPSDEEMKTFTLGLNGYNEDSPWTPKAKELITELLQRRAEG